LPDILQALPIGAPIERVYDAITTPAGLDEWWTLRSSGEPREGAEYTLYFGPEYDWRARVTRATASSEFELEFTRADDDWRGTRLGFRLQPRDAGGTWLEFRHTGWPEANDHYRISSHCWAMYLRILRRFLEHGERVAYDRRLDV
jgi:uncharacterized protein YndB with AHSA1/START domain